MTSKQPSERRRPVRPVDLVRPVFIAGGLALALSACTHTRHQPEIVGSVPDDYRLNHPIAIDDTVKTLDVPVSTNAARLTSGVKGNIQGFAQRFLDSGAAVIAVVTPSGSSDETAAVWLSYQVKDALVGAGVDPKKVDFRVYRAKGEGNAPIRIAFSAVSATTAGCGPWPDQVAKTSENTHYHNYGCATQQNLAAMVANPLDLLYPRGMSPADATRRAAVLANYQKGAPTQGDYSKEPGATVATGVGSK